MSQLRLPSEIKIFSKSSFFKFFRKFHLDSVVKIYHKKKIVIGIIIRIIKKLLKRTLDFLLLSNIFLELINPIKTCKYKIYHSDRHENRFFFLVLGAVHMR